MSFPLAIIRELPTEQPSGGLFASLLVPVVLVTSTRGREVFTNTRRLFERLNSIALEIRPFGTRIEAIWQGEQHVAEAGVAALETMLATVGLEPFNRASKAQRGGARALGSKYQWYFLSEYLGWDWERA